MCQFCIFVCYLGSPKGCQSLPIGLLQPSQKQHGWTQASEEDKDQEGYPVKKASQHTNSRQPKLSSRAVIQIIFYTFGGSNLK